ncbi:GTPase HflX [uncultured Ruthenibacterium sp.]|uniref:GTPase HflX n=1 Tax=uncultured Ruthenibacterium sp. TaxID=1905347 RepID=UPI00349E85F7
MTENGVAKAVLFGLDLGEYDMEKSMDELSALAQACGMEAVAQLVQKRDTPESATYLGEGRLAEGRLLCMNLGAECAIFDAELSGSQIRNLEQILEVPVIDRTMLILEIFKRRAVTNEGKLQTELATLRYRLPRLAGLGESLSRQGGGGTGGAGARRGAGESKLEYDRRHVRRRIEALSQRLAEMELRRAQTRKSRQKSGVPIVALVGYTNVGKSSLLNRLCGAEVPAADMLFATLDPTARKLTLPSGLDVVVVDTVGFVSRLPHGLVEAFKSTLEEAAYADVIVKVCDLSDPESSQQLAVTEQVLASLNCEDIPQFTVYNKCDRVSGAVPFDTSAICTSAATGYGIEKLLARLDEVLSDRVRHIAVLLPYDKLTLAALIRSQGTMLTEEYRSDGVYCEGIIKASQLHHFISYFTDPS